MINKFYIMIRKLKSLVTVATAAMKNMTTKSKKVPTGMTNHRRRKGSRRCRLPPKYVFLTSPDKTVMLFFTSPDLLLFLTTRDNIVGYTYHVT